GAGGADQRNEVVGRLVPHVVGDEAEGQGPHEVRLRGGLHVAVVVEKLGAPCVEDVGGKGAVALGDLVVAEQIADVGQLVGRAEQVGGGDRAVVGGEQVGEDGVHVHAGLEPLTEVPSAVPD